MPHSWPARARQRIGSAATLPMSGAGQEQAVQQRAQAVVLETTDVRETLDRKPGRKTRRSAQPVWSGPRLKRKVARTFGALEQAKQPRHAFLRAAQRVDVDLQCDMRHGGHALSGRSRAVIAPRPRWLR